MKTFKDIQVRDKLFSITTNGDHNAIIIEDIIYVHKNYTNEKFLGDKIIFKFSDNDHLYSTFIPFGNLKLSTKIISFYEEIDGKTQIVGNVLIGVDKKSTIKYHIEHIEDSIKYQNKVVKEGIEQIKKLNVTKDKLNEILESID